MDFPRKNPMHTGDFIANLNIEISRVSISVSKTKYFSPDPKIWPRIYWFKYPQVGIMTLLYEHLPPASVNSFLEESPSREK